MKKKIIIIASIMVSMLTALVIFLCCCNIDSCYYGKPTVDGIKEHLAERYNISLPRNVTMESYAAYIFIDGEYCAILNYDGYDEEFNSIFSYEGKEEYKQYYNSEYKCNYYKIEDMKIVTKNFSVPELDNKYGWLSLSNDSGSCRLLYFYELNKLLVDLYWI